MEVHLTNPSQTNSLVGRKNVLTSAWDLLFEENPKEWISFRPALGLYVYPCYACRQMFSSKSSLQDHVNRRVIVIRYNCSGCSSSVKTFYNRCSFLLHTRIHYNFEQGEINLREVCLFPLPFALAGFLPHPNIPQLYSDEEQLIDGNIYVNTQFYNPINNDRGKAVVILKPSDLVFKHDNLTLALKQVCRNIPKCQFITFEQLKLLRKTHLLAEENRLNQIQENRVDNVEIKEEQPSTEQEYQQQLTLPVISKVESLQEKKFKFPKCLDCNTFQRCTMAEHYQGENKPYDTNLSCSTCKFVASTQCALRAHIRVHEHLAPHVCPDCGKDFKTWQLLNLHMSEVCFHMAKHVRFRCAGRRCGKLFATNTTFAAHFRVHLKCTLTCSLCQITFVTECDAEKHKSDHVDECSFSELYHCTLCTNLGPLNVENYQQHITFHTTDTERYMYVYMCKFCRSYFRSTATYATHLFRCSAKQSNNSLKKNHHASKYITKDCDTCSNKIIFNANKPVKFCNRCKEQRDNKSSTKRYYCILCNKQILVGDKVKHMKLCHYANPRVVIRKLTSEEIRRHTELVTRRYSSDSPSKKKSKSESPRSDDKKKRKVYHRPRKSDMAPDLTADEPKPFDGTYYCKLCIYNSILRQEFHEHIKCHRDISTAYQCMECGECFVVKPSLVKHLLHFHNISDYESYLRNNDCYDIEAVKELEEIMKLAPGESKEPVKENQCRVCRQEFKDLIALNKHFRIHGMAFLLKNTK